MGRSGRAGALLNPAFGTLLVYLYFCQISLFFFICPKLVSGSTPPVLLSPLFNQKLLLLLPQSLPKHIWKGVVICLGGWEKEGVGFGDGEISGDSLPIHLQKKNKKKTGLTELLLDKGRHSCLVTCVWERSSDSWADRLSQQITDKSPRCSSL